MTSSKKIDDALSEFRKNGFSVLRNFVSDDLITESISEVSTALKKRNDWQKDRYLYWKGAKAIPERIEPVVDVCPSIWKICKSTELQNLLLKIFGEFPNILKDKVVVCPPGSHGYATHQDYVFYPFCNPDSMVTAAIALDDTTAENGALRLYSDQFHRSYTKWVPRYFSDSEQAELDTYDVGQTINQKPGDLVIFHSLTPHGSTPNNTQELRRVIYLNFNAKSAGDFYKKQRARYLSDIPSLSGSLT